MSELRIGAGRIGLGGIVMLWAAVAWGKPLERGIPELFSPGSGQDGVFRTTLLAGGPPRDEVTHEVPLAARFRSLGAALAASRSQVPVPSASGPFSFGWNPGKEIFERLPLSLGSPHAERATTLGRNVVTVGLTYTRADFDTFDGVSLDALRSVQPAFSDEFLARLPAADRMALGDDVIATRLAVDLDLDLFFLTVAWGVTHDIDVSVALAVHHARVKARAEAALVDVERNGLAFFTSDQPGLVPIGTVGACRTPLRCARDSFADDATGTGDLFLRSKWRFAETAFADLAVAGVLSVPTGNADDLIGYHDPTFTPWLIASQRFGRVSPHLNLGWAFRDGVDVSQGLWVAGADVRVTDWLTVAGDFLGFHDDKRDGFNDDVIQSAVSVRVNPIGDAVLGGSVQMPVEREGLRADVIGTVQLEYTF